MTHLMLSRHNALAGAGLAFAVGSLATLASSPALAD